MIDGQSVTAKLLYLPLRLLKPGRSLPILSGRLRGKKWLVDAGDLSCWLGTFQAEKQALFSKTICPQNVIFDIGGKVGFFALLASMLVGPGGQVFVFEPQPRNLFFLRKHLDLNKSRNVNVIDASVSYKNAAGAREQFPSSDQSQVKTCTLDSLLERGQIPLPDLIHIDLGGGEFAALCGARTLLSIAHPKIVLTTYEDVSHQECCAFLEMLEYRVEPIDEKSSGATRGIIATHI